MSTLIRTALCLALLSSAAPAIAQTGPFADGELLVHALNPATSKRTLWRINTVTGQASALLVDAPTVSSSADWVAYDPFRDGVLAFVKWNEVPNSNRLLLLRSDASVTDLGFADEKLSDLAPVGDGRVYLRKNGVLHVLDAANQIHPVLDAGGQQVTLAYQHLQYHAPTNSLFAAIHVQTPNPCSVTGVWMITAHRLPLTPDGTALSGPPSCSAFDYTTSGAPIGMDPLPDGGLLLTIAAGSAIPNDHLVRIDPVTLAITPWAKPDFNDLDGGVWSQALGKVIVLNDIDNTLRTFSFGEVGPGTVLPVSVAVGDGSSGTGAGNKIEDIETTGPTCPGSVASFGQGLAGKGGVVPKLGAGTCPRIGEMLPIYLGSGVGKAPAIVGFSLTTASYPLFGGTGYLVPPLVVQVPVTLSGLQNQTAGGWAQINLPVPNDPALSGAAVFGQGAVIDPAAAFGVALTPGLAIVFG